MNTGSCRLPAIFLTIVLGADLALSLLCAPAIQHTYAELLQPLYASSTPSDLPCFWFVCSLEEQSAAQPQFRKFCSLYVQRLGALLPAISLQHSHVRYRGTLVCRKALLISSPATHA